MVQERAARSRHEPVYSFAVGLGRVLFGALLRLKPVVSGIENIPRHGGAVLAITHFGYLDFALTEWITWSHTRRRIRFLATKSAFDKPVIGGLLRAMQHIPVDMTAGHDAYLHAVEALRRGELLGVFPEAGVSASFTVRELKTGAVRMAREAGVPIVPIAIWGGQLLKTKNHPTRIREAFRAAILVGVGAPVEVALNADPEAVTRQLRNGMQAMLDRVQKEYPRPGTGMWWQPAHLGGTAPSPEAAALAEAERQRRKASARV